MCFFFFFFWNCGSFSVATPNSDERGGGRYEHLVITVVTKPPLARTRWGGKEEILTLTEKGRTYF